MLPFSLLQTRPSASRIGTPEVARAKSSRRTQFAQLTPGRVWGRCGVEICIAGPRHVAARGARSSVRRLSMMLRVLRPRLSRAGRSAKHRAASGYLTNLRSSPPLESARDNVHLLRKARPPRRRLDLAFALTFLAPNAPIWKLTCDTACLPTSHELSTHGRKTPCKDATRVSNSVKSRPRSYVRHHNAGNGMPESISP